MSAAGTRVVLVLGASGGCGASTLAGALALAWQRERSGAWLVEADARRGDVAAAWDLPGDRTLADLGGVIEEIGAGHIRAATEAHASGVSVLVAPAAPGSEGWADAPAGRRLGGALGAAAGPDGRCAIDGGTGMSELARGLAGVATSALVVCAPRIASARRARSLATALGVPGRAATGIVVARGPGPAELGTRSIARATGLPVRGELPWSPAEAAEFGAGRWPRGRRGSLRSEVARLAGECGG